MIQFCGPLAAYNYVFEGKRSKLFFGKISKKKGRLILNHFFGKITFWNLAKAKIQFLRFCKRDKGKEGILKGNNFWKM